MNLTGNSLHIEILSIIRDGLKQRQQVHLLDAPLFCKIFGSECSEINKHAKIVSFHGTFEDEFKLIGSTDVSEPDINGHKCKWSYNTLFTIVNAKVIKFELFVLGNEHGLMGECFVTLEKLLSFRKGDTVNLAVDGELNGCQISLKVANDDIKLEKASQSNISVDIGKVIVKVIAAENVPTRREIYITTRVGVGKKNTSEPCTAQSDSHGHHSYLLNWCSAHDIQDMCSDLKVHVWERHHLRKDTCIGQTVFPLADFMNFSSPKPPQYMTVELAPYVEPKTYNRFGQYRKPITGSNCSGFGLQQPDHPLGKISLCIELSVNTWLPKAFFFTRPESKILTSIPLDQIDLNFSELKLNLKRLERWPKVVKQTIQSSLNWKERPTAVIIITVLFTWTCLFSKPWQCPLIIFGSFIAGGYVQRRSFTYTKVWKDEATAQRISKFQSIENKTKRIFFLAKKIAVKSGNAASCIEKFVNIMTWVNIHISFIVFTMLGTVCVLLSIVLFFVPFRWVLYGFGMLFIISGGGNFPLKINNKVAKKQIHVHHGMIFSHEWTDGYHGDGFTGFHLQGRYCELYTDPPILRAKEINSKGAPLDINIAGASVLDDFKVDLFENDESRPSTPGGFDEPHIPFSNCGRRLVYVVHLAKGGKNFLYMGFPSIQEKKDWIIAFKKVLTSNLHSHAHTKDRKRPSVTERLQQPVLRASKNFNAFRNLENIFMCTPDDFDLEHHAICRKLLKPSSKHTSQ